MGKIVWSLPGAPMDLKVKMDLNLVQVGCLGGHDRIVDRRKWKCARLLKCVELIDFSTSLSYDENLDQCFLSLPAEVVGISSGRDLANSKQER